tara:strand:- start:884 stop:1846 length:963 start_codon:yes stop_codon:yes gene_type:complete
MEEFGGHQDKVARMRPPLERSLTHWMYLMSPMGTQPAVNDGGRGRFDYNLFVDGGRSFNRPDFLWTAKNLLGATVDDFVEPPSATSMDFRPSGFAVMRQDWTRDSAYLVINYGPWGGGHSHADIMSFELFAYGEAMAVDAGIGVSYDDPNHRPWYVTSKAHNMMVFGDQNLDRREAVGVNPIWGTGDNMDYFSAEHHGYEYMGISHRRHFVFVKPNSSVPDAFPYFLVFDVFSSAKEPWKASFVLHSPMPSLGRGAGHFANDSAGLLVITPVAIEANSGTGLANLGGVSSPGRRPIEWLSLDQLTVGQGMVDDLPVVLFP